MQILASEQTTYKSSTVKSSRAIWLGLSLNTLIEVQEAALLSLGAAGKVLEVDDWAEAQVGQREQTAGPLLEAGLEKCRQARPPLAIVVHAMCH